VPGVRAAVRRMRVRAARRDQRGVALPMAMAVVTITILLGLILTDLAVFQAGKTATDRYRTQALATAEAGLDAAVDHLRVDPTYTGAGPTDFDAGPGTYTVTVTAGSATDRRIVDVTAISPSASASRRATRRIHAEVRIASNTTAFTTPVAFPDALLCGGGSCASTGGLDVTGGVYSDGPLALGASSADTVDGAVSVANGDVSLAHGTTVVGAVATSGSAMLAAGTAVDGPLTASAGVANDGQVTGPVRAGGATTGSGSYAGGAVDHVSPVPRPAVRTRPSYTWDDRTAGATVWPTSTGFEQWMAARVAGGQPVHGVHRILDATPVTLSGPAAVDGDLVIVAAGPLVADGAGWTATAGPATVALLATGRSATDQLTCTGTVNTGAGVTLLWWSDGPVRLSCGGTIRGAVAAPTIVHDGGATLAVTHAAPTIPAGFTLPAATATTTRTVQVLRFWLG
jgi:hypothetical protein